MIDKWFMGDLEHIFAKHDVAVFIDESAQAEFLLKCIPEDWQKFHVSNEVEDLHVKYQIEKNRSAKRKTLLYTRVSKNSLKFVREYCETDGCLEISQLQNYIKLKVHQTLNLNINLPKEELISAAKISVGKDKNYWLDLSHKGASEIFDLEKELVIFLHDPDHYAQNRYDKQLCETFFRKVSQLINQDYMPKPAATVADEVARVILDNQIFNKNHQVLDRVYKNWLDSVTHKNSFSRYVDKYALPKKFDHWKVALSHPFEQIDKLWLKEIGQQLSEKEKFPVIIEKISQRDNNPQARALGIVFWKDVKTLLEFDSNDIAYLNSLDEVVEFYISRFQKLDAAIRRLYARFLNDRALIEPFQNLYKEFVSIFLDKWFSYFNDYRENQTGVLQRIIDANDCKVAIIVGDGITYEIAEEISGSVSDDIELNKDFVLADFPSETENNMSRIYIDNGSTEKIHMDRVKYLVNQNSDKELEFADLESVDTDERAAQYLICTHKDFDYMGEKFQHKALKYFPGTIDAIARKINLLLRAGYQKVFLISDHGFVLSGLLCESEKINADIRGVAHKAERFIKADERQTELPDSMIEIKKKHENFNYFYFSTTLNPFKTPGVYGYSHGGLAPQELITPFFCWQVSDQPGSNLVVKFANKSDLSSVAGQIYQVKIQSVKAADNLLNINRKIYLVFFEKGAQINKSDIFTIDSNQTITKEYSFDGSTEVEVQLLDADSRECLDRAIIKRSYDRDLGGLL
jgi:hypothetical protein